MKLLLYFTGLTFLLASLLNDCSAENSLIGKITDATTHEPIPLVVVGFPQLKLFAMSDDSGNYKIMHVPSGIFTIQTELLGYKSVIKQIKINGETKLDIALNSTTASLQEIVITGFGTLTTTQRTPTPVIVVSHQDLLEAPATNVVDAIANEPGVTAITTGPGVSKPEINGLGFNRVITTLDGVRQQDFQWGDEHGIQIDPYAVNDVEILRGPASLQYGSDAMGGVVNFKTASFPEDGLIKGNFTTDYGSNNGEFGNSFDVSGNHHGFVWDLRISDEMAHCYQDPKDGYVWGTAFTERNARLSLGINKDWGYSRFTLSALHRTIEIPDGNRNAQGQFIFDYPIDGSYLPSRSNFLSYNPTYVGYQQIEHDVAAWNTSINLGRGKLLADLSYSQDHREEIDTGAVALLNMFMRNIGYGAKYQFNADNQIKYNVGIGGMWEGMQNAPEAVHPYTSVFLVPSYQLFDIGAFAIAQRDFENMTVTGGLRYDNRNETGQSLYLLNQNTSEQLIVGANTPGAYQNFEGFTHTYGGVSGSIGMSYQLKHEAYLKASVSKGYRAPAITEIGENGVHPGTNNYEIGNRILMPEASYQVDLAIGKRASNYNVELTGFFNDINNFIYASKIGSKNGGDSITNGFPTFKFQSNTVFITGATAELDLHPASVHWVELDNGVSYIYNYILKQTDSTQHLPWTPATRLRSELKFKLKDGKGLLRKTYFKVGLTHYWAQTNIYSAYLTELPSAAYTLYEAGMGTDFVNRKSGKTFCSLFVNITNLTNLAYADHTNRLQYFLTHNIPAQNGQPAQYAVPMAVTNTSQGIYNMGRNIEVKLVIPFGGKGMKASN